MPFITTNDNVSIYYEIHGEGKPLFMLPGWICGAMGNQKKYSTATAFPGMPWT